MSGIIGGAGGVFYEKETATAPPLGGGGGRLSFRIVNLSIPIDSLNCGTCDMLPGGDDTMSGPARQRLFFPWPAVTVLRRLSCVLSCGRCLTLPEP